MTLALRLLGVILVAAGAYGLARPDFSYTTKTHQAKFAGMELSVDERKRMEIPMWLSGGAVALGVGLLLIGGRRSG